GLDEDLGEFITPLADLAAKVEKLTAEIGMKAMKNPEEVGAAAVPYLRVVGHLIYAYFFTRMAKIALEKRDSGDDFYKAKLATARFYFARLLPETAMLIRQARAGSASLMELDAALF
ncbi:MAG TPA: acyl-CoA dehydrogenase C-terminal domain-containing protein, partial [Oxalicibacterium sp.]|nr:acyl-CoA dehydrogenase C-terminal domain-containing protein [Oxalicibacterium sp.]